MAYVNSIVRHAGAGGSAGPTRPYVKIQNPPYVTIRKTLPCQERGYDKAEVEVRAYDGRTNCAFLQCRKQPSNGKSRITNYSAGGVRNPVLLVQIPH